MLLAHHCQAIAGRRYHMWLETDGLSRMTRGKGPDVET